MVAPSVGTPTKEVRHPLGDFALATVRIADYEIAKITDPNSPVGMAKLSTPASAELTAELDGATEWLGLPSDEILLGALSRTIARTLGDGLVAVDVANGRGPLLDAVPLTCATARQMNSTEVLAAVHRALAAGAESDSTAPSEVYFNFIGEVPEGTEPVQETPSALGHMLEVRVYRTAGDVHVDWWYDINRFASHTVSELSEQFPLSLYEMTSDALPPF
ncbi:hypothetical protein [Mycolicibacterium holsaticum]|uniref:hypothetical protein n=1 Tax=Mycolicibacterium holsaticum TaxID=152142 RepID=UPI001C7E0C75|nr:hypothetical protein [Mycolicibacterium holsaticum]QZA10418.1 hypothetical protein K3U96_14015 [Mycolicibacterium holsaticum DSM 44478 = JCM 12374]UNC12077.1 hypothetical protein H5U41_12815 [Mycolicibacterium holsaticum DSM 44478 = JCM 12374]